MGNRRRLLGDVTAFQIVAGAAAAVTAAWVASWLGVGGTLAGAAVGSLVATISTALYAQTLDRGRTLIVKPGQSIAEAYAEADTTEPVLVGPPPTVNWKAIFVAAAMVLALALAAITTYELISNQTWGGENRDGTTLGGVLGDGGAPKDTPSPTPSTSPTPTPSPSLTPTVIPTETPVPTESPTAQPTPTGEPTP